MRRSKFVVGLLVLSAVLFACFGGGCDDTSGKVVAPPKSDSGVQKISVEMETNSDGKTNEQQNIVDRYAMDDDIGAIKHLYVISAYSGQVIIYSTVRGKVTSSGKRLTPNTVAAGRASKGELAPVPYGIPVDIGGAERRTSEVLQDDGTYGSSIEYLYWFDSAGKYHQHYVTGGQILHVSDQPIAVKSIIINMEITGGDK